MKAKSISNCGKKKTQSHDFTKSGSFPDNVAKVIITKWQKKGRSSWIYKVLKKITHKNEKKKKVRILKLNS